MAFEAAVAETVGSEDLGIEPSVAVVTVETFAVFKKRSVPTEFASAIAFALSAEEICVALVGDGIVSFVVEIGTDAFDIAGEFFVNFEAEPSGKVRSFVRETLPLFGFTPEAISLCPPAVSKAAVVAFMFLSNGCLLSADPGARRFSTCNDEPSALMRDDLAHQPLPAIDSATTKKTRLVQARLRETQPFRS